MGLWDAIASNINATIGAGVDIFMNERNNSQNRDLFREGNAFNESMIDKMNDWNSPAHMKQLFEEAGINPAFMFANNPPSPVSGSTSSVAPPQMNAPDIGQHIRNLFDATKLKYETLKTEAQTNNILEQTESYKIANAQAEERFQNSMQQLRSQTGLTDVERKYKETQLETEKLHQKEVFYNAENLRYNLSLIEEKKNTEKWTQAHYEAVINRMVHLTPFEAQNLASQSNLNNEQSKVASETLNKIQQEVVNMVKQGAQIDAVTIGQVIRNEVDNVKANNEISSALLLDGSPVINAIYQHCGGMIGDLVKTIGAFDLGATSSDSKSSHSDKVNKARSQSSWYFNK